MGDADLLDGPTKEDPGGLLESLTNLAECKVTAQEQGPQGWSAQKLNREMNEALMHYKTTARI